MLQITSSEKNTFENNMHRAVAFFDFFCRCGNDDDADWYGEKGTKFYHSKAKP